MRYEHALYAARGRDLLEVVRALSDSVDTAMLVGHNPSLEDLTATLSGCSPHYPTAALGTLELAIDDWGDGGPGCGTLTSPVTAARVRAGD